MASKVSGFGRRRLSNETEEVVPEVVAERFQPVAVDKAVLNEAVEDTLNHADPRHAESMRKLWSMDPQSVPSQMYYTDYVRATEQSKFAEMCRKTHVVNEVLTQEESARVSDYAREFSLVFRNSASHDHGFFSARRAIDHDILLSKFPPHMKYLDFGGSVLYHARLGHKNAVVMSPFDVDSKDPTRAALTRLALKKMVVDVGSSSESQEVARSVLAKEGLYHLSETVQTTVAKAPVSIAVHVYDVPLEDWPRMMERCGVRVHEGCMHFINDFFETDEGEFPFSGARFEIDRKSDLFRMRVGRSSSLWYTHRWSDFMRYGANQILHTETGRYSYQITERRQDTIFYRILRVDSTTPVNMDQHYALPTVPMVDVHGFEVFPDAKPGGHSNRRQMVARTYQFPQALWERMLTYAKAELDRGGLSYDKLTNYYRTVVPRQSINGVHISGGQSVSIGEVPALIAMVGVVAYADSVLLQRTVRARTDQIQQERSLRDESTICKAFCAFLDALVMVGKLPFSPFASISSKVTSAYVALVREKLVTWRPRVTLRSLNVALIVDHKELGYSVRKPELLQHTELLSDDVVSSMIDLVRADSDVARELLDTCGSHLFPGIRESLENSVQSETAVHDGDDANDTSAEEEKPGQTEFYRDGRKIRRTVYESPGRAQEIAERRLAVQEALTECLTETRSLRYTCARIAREVLIHGNPREDVLRKRNEEFFNPDLWYVNNGVLQRSVLSPKQTEFTYSGVYVPVPAHDREQLVPVSEKAYMGNDSSTGKSVHRLHYVLPYQYTGYVLVIDNLKIFNGPAVSDILTRALELDDNQFLFELTVHAGPPGCGKTTTVARDGNPDTDIFLAPTRKSKTGLSERLKTNHGCDSRKLWRICRTLDSFLVNYVTLPASAKQGFTRLLADECGMARAGKWIAAAAMLGVQEVHAYGDPLQITHKARVEVPVLYVTLKPKILEEEFVTHRNPALIVAAYNYMYGNSIRTSSKVNGFIKRVKHISEVKFEDNTMFMSMYQKDKVYMAQATAGLVLLNFVQCSVHEGQGDTTRFVALLNTEVRKRSADDAFYLYMLREYCLVALSRATEGVYYIKLSDEPDLVTEMIEKAHDMRRVEAAKELDTQGENNLMF